MPVILLGTLDTKGTEFQFVRDLLRDAGVATMAIDAGVQKPPVFPPDIPREEVYRAAGTTLETVFRAADRGKAIEAAARGAAKLVADLHARGQVDGILSLGGSAGTTIGTAAMRALPFGVPKITVEIASAIADHAFTMQPRLGGEFTHVRKMLAGSGGAGVYRR